MTIINVNIWASATGRRSRSAIGRRRPTRRDLRELQVLTLVFRGATNRDQAQALMISAATVKTHLRHIYAKLSVSDRAAAVAEALHRGLLTTEKR